MNRRGFLRNLAGALVSAMVILEVGRPKEPPIYRDPRLKGLKGLTFHEDIRIYAPYIPLFVTPPLVTETLQSVKPIDGEVKGVVYFVNKKETWWTRLLKRLGLSKEAPRYNPMRLE